MKTFLSYSSLVLFILSYVACGQGGSEIGNPKKPTGGVAISIVGYQSSLLQALQWGDLTVSGLDVTTAQIVLDQIRFRPALGCEDSEPVSQELSQEEKDPLRFDGPFVVDLLETGTVSGLEEINIPAGAYCRIKLILKKLDSNVSEGDTIAGKSVLIEGTRGDGLKFRVSLEVDEEFKLENEEGGFNINAAGSLDRFFIAFDLDQWFVSTALNTASLEVSFDENEEPIILIDKDNNTETHQAIINNLKLSADLFEDQDDDNKLDPDEQDDPLAEGTTEP